MQQQQQPAQKPKKKIKVVRPVNGIDQEVEIEVDADSGPGWGPNDKHALLNHAWPRVDGPLKVSGIAHYTHDMRPKGMLYARILRCPYGHAKVKSIDTSAAEKIPGVAAVIQGPITELRFAGAPVAAVAAKTPEIAADALRAIVVDYEVLRHVVHASEAIKPGAPKVVEQEENLQQKAKAGDLAKVQAAFGTADAIVEEEYISARIHHACLETHGVVVDFSGGDTATVYASTQGTFTIPKDAADQLGLKQSDVTSIVQHMGGGFGSKFGIGVAGLFACKLSKQTKTPVKLMLNRYDEFVMAGNRSGSWQKIKAGVKNDGTLVALQATQYRLGGVGQGSQAGQPYIYRAGDFYREIYALHTNEDATVAMRAPGHPEASFAMESLMDELSYKIKMDPMEFRKKNLRDPVYHRQLDRGAKAIGWERRNPVAGGNSGVLKRGMGCAVGTWGGGGNDACKVDVTIGRDGSVLVAVGTQDLGTGTRTFTRAIVAEEFGLQIADIKEEIGSSKLGGANDSGGSTTAASLSPSVKDGAYKARMLFAERVASLFDNAKPEEITFANGNVTGKGKTIAWKQACAALPSAGVTGHGVWRTELQSTGIHGASFAEVEVDTETGLVKPIKMVHVQDGGLPLNRLTMESQINGGMIQALGMALYEGRVMDATLGMQVNPGFGDYKLPGSLEMPEMIPIIDDDDKREVVIGIAEGCIIPALGAVVNAVYNACGVRVRETPITPDKILMGLMKA